MAEGWSATAANAALSTLTSTYQWVQLHVGAPGVAGTANVASNTTRKQVTAWSTPSGGAVANTASATWSAVPAAEDYTHWTAWTASSSGTFGMSGTITANPVGVGDDFTAAVGAITASIPIAS